MAASIIHNGSKTVTTTGTAEPLSATAHTQANWITFYPLVTNTGSIYIGGPGVTATSGAILGSGDAFVSWPLSAFNCYDLSTIYIDASVSGEGVQFVYASI